MTFAFSEPKLVGATLDCMTARSHGASAAGDSVGPVKSQEQAAAEAYAKSPAAICPREPRLLSIAGLPDQLAYGRRTEFDISNVPSGAPSWEPIDTVTSSRLTMTSEGEDTPFFTADTAVGKRFFIRLDRGDRPAIVRLAWTQRDGATGDECPLSADTVVRPQKGQKARLEVLSPNGNAGFRIALDAPCSTTDPTPIRIRVGAYAVRASDPCKGWDKNLTRPRFVTGVASGLTMRFEADATGRANVTVTRGSAAIWRGVLTTRHRHSLGTPRFRVWQGTDAFINYCLNRRKPTYSKNLRLFCWHPGKDPWEVGKEYLQRK